MTHFSALPMTVPSYHFVTRQNYSKLSTDLLLIVFFYVFTAQLSQRALLGRDALILAGLVLGWHLASKFTAMYNDFRTVTFINEVLALVPNLLTQFGLITVFLFFLDDKNHARSFSLWFILLLGFAIIVKMYLLRKVHQYWNLKGINQKALVVLGDSNKTWGFIDFVQKNNQLGYTIVGKHTLPNKITSAQDLNPLIAYLEKTHHYYLLDELIIISENFHEDVAKQITQWADSKGILLRFTPRFLQFHSSRFTLEQFGNQPLISVRSTLLDTEYYWMFKRITDFTAASVIFLLFGSIFFPIISIAILMESKGSILVKKKLLGQGGMEFDSWEFSTTKSGKLTQIGQFLTKTHLDKFPRFFNVIVGDMSIVGPRAYNSSEVYRLKLVANNYKARYKVKPGLVDWTEVNFSEFMKETEPSLLQKRVQLDIWYIENWNPFLDVQVIVKTMYSMLRGILFL